MKKIKSCSIRRLGGGGVRGGCEKRGSLGLADPLVKNKG